MSDSESNPNNALEDDEIYLQGRPVNVSDGNAGMDVVRKSDGSVVSANKGAPEALAERAEKRDPVERNTNQPTMPRTQSRTNGGSKGLEGVRGAARKDSKLKFSALLHHLNDESLNRSFFRLKKTAAVGVDGVSWQEYERDLEANLKGLHGRIHRGSYRAKPSRRGWIPKPDGRKRPLGIASLEDKIVQAAVSEAMRPEEEGVEGNNRRPSIFWVLHISVPEEGVTGVLLFIDIRLRSGCGRH